MSRKDEVLDIPRDRLLDKGTDADGKKIRTYKAIQGFVYALRTVKIRQENNQQTDHVDLHDTGEAHRSMLLRAVQDAFLIVFDEDKPDGKISDNVDLNRVFDLSEDELNKLSNDILTELQQDVRQQIA